MICVNRPRSDKEFLNARKLVSVSLLLALESSQYKN